VPISERRAAAGPHRGPDKSLSRSVPGHAGVLPGTPHARRRRERLLLHAGLSGRLALRDGGVPLSRILAPNKEVTVVRALQDFGVNSVNKHLSWASQEEYWTHNVSGAYLDELPRPPRLSAGTPPSAVSTLPARRRCAADVNGCLLHAVQGRSQFPCGVPTTCPDMVGRPRRRPRLEAKVGAKARVRG